MSTGTSQSISALFVQTGGHYFGLDGVDPWDIERDARKYNGPNPVVAHPPCTRWCQLAYIVQKRYGYMVGNDGGCFESALESVRRWGGVLEHPAFSYAWRTFGITRPPRTGWQRSSICFSGMQCAPGWVCQVSQSAYGHRARKRTWLLYVGENAPAPMLWVEPTPTAQVSFCKNHGDSPLPRLSKKEASQTPIAFRDALLSLARGSRPACAEAA